MTANTRLGTDAIERFVGKLRDSLQDDTFVRVVLSGSTGTGDDVKKVSGRLITLRGGTWLSLTLHHATRDVTQNLTPDAAADWVKERLEQAFRSAFLATTRRDWQLTGSARGRARLVSHKPATVTPPSREHDRAAKAILDESAHDWLRGLGVVSADGQVRRAMMDKWTQINRYLEIVTHLIGESKWASRNTLTPVLADMGCGKAYLTFGLWHLFHRIRKQPVRIIGVEVRPELVAATRALAAAVAADGLEFVQGGIASTRLPALDGLIALHACDTATDDAILRGIELGARLIVVAPCCHKEVRPQLGRPEPLDHVLRHGLMTERMAEWATDGLRIMFLEWAGFHTKAIEFVGGEHTPKNLLLAGVRVRPGFGDFHVRDRIVQFMKFFGIRRHRLAVLLEKGT